MAIVDCMVFGLEPKWRGCPYSNLAGPPQHDEAQLRARHDAGSLRRHTEAAPLHQWARYAAAMILNRRGGEVRESGECGR